MREGSYQKRNHMVNGKLFGDLKGPACIQRTDLSIAGILPLEALTPLPPAPLLEGSWHLQLPVARSASLTLPLGTCYSGRVPPTPSPPGCPAHWRSCGLCLRPSWPAHLCSHLGSSCPSACPSPLPGVHPDSSQRVIRITWLVHLPFWLLLPIRAPWPTWWSLSSLPSPVAPPRPPTIQASAPWGGLLRPPSHIVPSLPQWASGHQPCLIFTFFNQRQAWHPWENK